MIELDRETIDKAAQGDKAAFTKLYGHYAPFVWRTVFRSAGDDTEVTREIVQDTFIKIHRNLRKFKHQASLSTWIYTISYSMMMDYIKKKLKRKSIQLPDTIAAPEHENSYEIQQIVQKAMASLNADERFILTARELDGVTFEELAVITGTSSGTLRTRLHRIKEGLRTTLEFAKTHEEHTNGIPGERVLPGTGTYA